MSQQAKFKVVIVGGGVAGLVLGNILERLDIDYVILEGYSEIAPQAGASIGNFAGSMRIYDQLGCVDKLEETGVSPVNHIQISINDKRIPRFPAVGAHILERFGYQNHFLDRQHVLQALYDTLKHKERVLLNKRVKTIEETKSGVRVVTEDKDSFSGDIVVGADGVHSVVRREMRRIADIADPGYFPADELKKLPCDYRCCFGIATGVKNAPPVFLHTGMHSGYSMLVIKRDNGRIYWFLMEKLKQTIYYADGAPRYTKADEEELYAKYGGVQVAENLTWGDLYRNAIACNITPLFEHVFEKWHYHRIITIGDAAHKMNPISGSGGNSAVETAAALANILSRKLDAAGGHALTDADIEAVFSETQALRHKRVELLMRKAHEQQAVEAMESPLSRVLVPLLLPLTPYEARFERGMGHLVDAVRVEKLPVPYKRRFMPFTDELPAKPMDAKTVRLVQLGAFAGFLGLFYLARVSFAIPVGVNLLAEAAGEKARLGSNFRMHYTGAEEIDKVLQLLVGFFSFVVTSIGSARYVQLAYFLAVLTPCILIWTIESYRRGHHSIGAFFFNWPSLFALGYQLRGIGLVAPLYGALQVWMMSSPMYSRTTGRIVDAAIAKAVLPAVCLVYVVPTVLMFIPHGNIDLWQCIMAVWQPAPIFVSIVTALFARCIRIWEQPDKAMIERGDDFSIYNNKDLPYLNNAYAFAFYSSAVTHVCTLAYIWSRPDLSITRVFLGVPIPFFGDKSIPGGDTSIGVMLKYDLIFYALAAVGMCLYTVFDMRRLGYTTTREAMRAAATAIAGFVALGPGAMYAGTWWWRENLIAGLCKP